MIDYFDTLPEDVICIGPKILNKDGSLQSCGKLQWGKRLQHIISLYGLHKIFPLRLINPILDSRPDKTHRTGWVAGCCMMIPRKKYLKIGGLNENLRFYGEEPEFGYRTDNLGYKTVYYHEAAIIHLGGVATATKEGKLQKTFDKEIAQYDSLVLQTVGRKEAIRITKRTILSLRIKKIFYPNKDFINSRIKHECKVVSYFKQKCKEI